MLVGRFLTISRTVKFYVIMLLDFVPALLARFGAPSRAQRLAVFSVLSAILFGMFSLTQRESGTPLSPEFFVSVISNPAHLSDEDKSRYYESFAALRRGDYAAARAAIVDISNRGLVSEVLARLYLKPDYVASKEELAAWLDANPDHPSAPQLSNIARARGVNAPRIEPEKPLKGEGYADHLGRTGMPDGWYRGLTLWREGSFADALTQFEAVAADTSNTRWHRAAGHYWAYRAANKLNENRTARHHLKDAASYETTFYGLLARQQLGSLNIDAQAPTVSNRVRHDPRAIRAALFAQLGYTDEAEEELRHLYSALDKSERKGIITLAHELNLANLQVRLAKLSELTDAEERFASYPMPQYVIDTEAARNPALLLAIARNESGFRESVSSSAGAVGLMQMLPSTAQTVERRVGREALQVASTSDMLEPIATRLSDPATSVRYSAEYLAILEKDPAVGNNLVRVLAAYNAGPGNVASWTSIARAIDDPLLYIEMIPYAETRNYVMQVMAQSWIYSALLGESPETLRALAGGSWPTFQG